MGLPIVAIVGRPNVGKSSLFNVIVGRRSSIVEPTPGVTRDRVSAVCDYDDAYFELVDTGGYGIEDIDDLTEHIERQIHFAIDEAGLILFVVDVRDGIVPLDRKMADLLRRYHDRVRLVANKVDQPNLAPQAAEFSQLGFGEAQCVSAVHGLGRHELKELILEHVGRIGGGAPEDPVMKIALVGRRNTGKSTFINALAGQERVIVSEVPGTTRDAVDVRFEKDGRVVLAIDTAGVRKKGKIADAIEFYGYTRATRSIRRADVVLLLIDATVPISQVDKKLATYVVEQYKATVIVVNKWYLAKEK
ncbi:MAG: ribosome biogenesis GTPase Der, partial [Planctomycetes bacterium]|nr:ribosome biogenesis GTPase Der [Planctomycetota bacterium]